MQGTFRFGTINTYFFLLRKFPFGYRQQTFFRGNLQGHNQLYTRYCRYLRSMINFVLLLFRNQFLFEIKFTKKWIFILNLSNQFLDFIQPRGGKNKPKVFIIQRGSNFRFIFIPFNYGISLLTVYFLGDNRLFGLDIQSRK